MRIAPARYLIIAMIIFACILPANATIVDVSPVDAPQGAVILIMDGVSSCYIYPEFTPYAIDGSILDKAEIKNMSFIFGQSCRVLDVTAPQTYTEAGHSVLVTGYSKAIGELVEGSETTIYDVAHDYDYLTFAIMEKGDFAAMCNKQDVVVHDVANSVNNPEMIVKTNVHSAEKKQISMDMASLLQNEASLIHPQLQHYPEGSQERYDAYNRWAIETAIKAIDFMSTEYPNEHYILTINVGATDSAGHYKKDSGYIATIEGVDSSCEPLYDICNENNLAFFLTGDHGMAFPTKDSRGGHQSKTYSVIREAQKVPFSVASHNVEAGLIKGEYGQEDIAPTILSVLELPDELRISDGSEMPVKEHTSISVKAFDEGDILLLENGITRGQASNTNNCLFRGVEVGSNYTIRFLQAGDVKNVIEKEIHLKKSENIVFNSHENKQESSIDLNSRHIIGGTLIGLINVTGLAMIRKVLKE
ncbi:alkaline phosphatase family protein [Methanolobus sp. ZRKC3]|uniref:alkaline phosphatase family protein n=1 Tax=Methanolobus sp. ZRKC3 TaxID=3125786 RepID=UPI00324C44AD